MAERPEWISRDKLADYWPSLAGRMPEILALEKRGPPFQIGAARKAWYRAEAVEAWLLAEEERQASARKNAPKIQRPKNVEPFPTRRPKRRTTKMDRHLARQA